MVLMTLCCHAGDLAMLNTGLLTDNDKDHFLNSPYFCTAVSLRLKGHKRYLYHRGECKLSSINAHSNSRSCVSAGRCIQVASLLTFFS